MTILVWQQITTFHVTDTQWYPGNDHFYEGYRSSPGYANHHYYFRNKEAAEAFIAKKPFKWKKGRKLAGTEDFLIHPNTGRLHRVPETYSSVGELQDVNDNATC